MRDTRDERPLTRVWVFALSAAIAGLAGGMFGQLREAAAASDFQLFDNLPLLLFAVITGVTSVSGAAVGGFLLMLLPVVQSAYPSLAGVAVWVSVSPLRAGP